MIPIMIHNFKKTKPIPKPKPTIPPKKPETEHWLIFDDIIHQILF